MWFIIVTKNNPAKGNPSAKLGVLLEGIIVPVKLTFIPVKTFVTLILLAV